MSLMSELISNVQVGVDAKVHRDALLQQFTFLNFKI